MTILKHKSQKDNQLQQMIDGVKSGKVDPHQTALDIVSKLSNDQKKALKQILPQFKVLGKKMGVPDDNLSKFINELTGQL